MQARKPDESPAIYGLKPHRQWKSVLRTLPRPDNNRCFCKTGRDFPNPSRRALGPTQPTIQWIPGPSRGVKRPGRGVHNPPHLAPRLKKE